MQDKPLKSRAPRWYRPSAVARSLALRPRVYVSAILVAGVLALLPASLSASLRSVVAADAGFLAYLVLSMRVMATFSHETVRRRAARQDHGGVVILAIILLAIGASFVAIAGLLAEAKEAAGSHKFMLAGLAGVTVILSWMVMQVVFTFHYAHEYYHPEDDEDGRRGGLDFPNDDCPDYWDFFYYATSIGATSQTSDVAISSKSLRRLTTVHAICSFFFNTAVLALAINIGASLL